MTAYAPAYTAYAVARSYATAYTAYGAVAVIYGRDAAAQATLDIPHATAYVVR